MDMYALNIPQLAVTARSHTQRRISGWLHASGAIVARLQPQTRSKVSGQWFQHIERWAVRYVRLTFALQQIRQRRGRNESIFADFAI